LDPLYLIDPAAAKYEVALIAHHRLTAGKCLVRRVESNVNPLIRQCAEASWDGFAMSADLR
jgi:hypothetical protein